MENRISLEMLVRDVASMRTIGRSIARTVRPERKRGQIKRATSLPFLLCTGRFLHPTKPTLAPAMAVAYFNSLIRAFGLGLHSQNGSWLCMRQFFVRFPVVVMTIASARKAIDAVPAVTGEILVSNGVNSVNAQGNVKNILVPCSTADSTQIRP